MRRAHSHLPLEYRQGRAERLANGSKLSCPCGYLTRAWAWWLAGWNDADIELEVST